MRKDLAMCSQANVVLPLFLGLKDPSIHCGLGSEDVRSGGGGGGGGGGHAGRGNYCHFLQTGIIICVLTFSLDVVYQNTESGDIVFLLPSKGTYLTQREFV